jgi:asparagine synthase (glutamine-hydrolysing)
MCGIIGHLNWSGPGPLSGERFSELIDLMTHRGPSSAGQFGEGPVALGVRRLAIIDPIGGDQPITSSDGRYVIVFNGEVYNYKEIREDLLRKGYPITTGSDTETLLYAFIDAGPACLDLLNGMFAVAIWDRAERRLFLARDRLGVKPLYYTAAAGGFLFASELTPIRHAASDSLRVDLRSVADLLAYWYICEPKTIFEGVRQLEPGHFMLIDERSTRTVRWWRVPTEGEVDIGYHEAQEELVSLLRDAVRLRMRADVPVGTLLSGGIDSGLVTAYAREFASHLECFTLGFKEKSYSEVALASQTADRLSVELVADTMQEIDAPLIDTILGSIDEPLGNASLIPTYLLFKLASERVNVVLTGEGGDELFGGYPTYQAPYVRLATDWLPDAAIRMAASAVRALPVSHRRISLDYRLKRLFKGIRLPVEQAHASWREVLNIADQADLFRPEVALALTEYDPFVPFARAFNQSRGLEDANRFMHADLHTYLLNDHLRKIDRMSMVHSVEAREPMLDVRIVEFAMRLPSRHKVSLFHTKRILRDIARPILPAPVVAGAKKGLTPPIPAWIASDLSGYVREQLDGGLVSELFEPAAVSLLLEEHRQRQRDHSRLIWALLSLQVWARHAGVAA